MAASGTDGTVVMWRAENPKRPVPLTRFHSGGVCDIAFVPDETALVAVGRERFDVVDVTSDKPTDRILTQPFNCGMSVSPDGLTLALATGEGIQFYELASRRKLDQLTLDSENVITAVAYRPNQNQSQAENLIVAARRGEKELQVWDVANSRLLWKLEGCTKPPETIAITPDGTRVIAFGPEDTEPAIWKLD